MKTIRKQIIFATLCMCCISNRMEVDGSISFDPVVIQVKGEQNGMLGENNVMTHRSSHNISIVNDKFMLDGQSLHIVSGSLHYFRLPAAYWRDRLRKLKAAGLNSVSTYVEWSYHEPEEREYMFDGDRDIARFVQTAAEVGLHVLLRPGPYICAERDLGGFPYWILGKYPNIKLRTTDKRFIEETKIWMAKLFTHLSPLLFGNGGPIILVQVENEYGSYGSDKAYKEQIRDILRNHVGTNALLYTTDGAPASYFRAGAVAGALTTIDFGVNADVPAYYRGLRKFMPHGPLMNSEFYPGWLTHWGETIQRVRTEDVVKTLKAMLNNNVNVNFYMFFGGTNFEFTAGANYGDNYRADITSYDYDAPLSEAGDPTPKYYAIREALKEHHFEDKNLLPPIPSPKGAYGKLSLRAQLKLLSPNGRTGLGKKYDDVVGTKLPTFEQLRQRGGLILYEIVLNEANGTLTITQPRDWIYVYVDEGILSTVTLNNKSLNGRWSITGYPLEHIKVNSSANYVESESSQGPVLYDGSFTLPPGEPLDTFLDTTVWSKGYIWINGHNLGRYWPRLGPQITLYVPGVWLKAAPSTNHIQILELEKAPLELTIESIDHPILNRTGNFHTV
ncbi:beta-galactosidase-like [Aphomia sociella]